jgi:hypothetical protein
MHHFSVAFRCMLSVKRLIKLYAVSINATVGVPNGKGKDRNTGV